MWQNSRADNVGYSIVPQEKTYGNVAVTCKTISWLKECLDLSGRIQFL